MLTVSTLWLMICHQHPSPSEQMTQNWHAPMNLCVDGSESESKSKNGGENGGESAETEKQG